MLRDSSYSDVIGLEVSDFWILVAAERVWTYYILQNTNLTDFTLFDLSLIFAF